jgi:pimeloyl-ACP methyl ester carboxylesterase
VTNDSRSLNGINLTNVRGKSLYYKRLGIHDGPPLIFIHGLGGTSDCYYPLISSLALDTTHSLHLFDLEGHGLSPSSALSCLSIESFARDVKRVFDHAELTAASSRPATIIGMSYCAYFCSTKPGIGA